MNLQKELRSATMKRKKSTHRQVPKPEAVVTQLLRGLQPAPELGEPNLWFGWVRKAEGGTGVVLREPWKWHNSQRHTWESGDVLMCLLTLGWAWSLGIANQSSATAITSFVILYFMCYFSCISSHDLSYLSSLPRSYFLIALGCTNQRFRK